MMFKNLILSGMRFSDWIVGNYMFILILLSIFLSLSLNLNLEYLKLKFKNRMILLENNINHILGLHLTA
jgi:hypothetical protein